jgi:K+-sensing histidine kinase KdpD
MLVATAEEDRLNFRQERSRFMGYRLASPFCSCIVQNYLDRQGLAMSERERSEDQTERLSLWARAGQQRFAGRIMKSPREVLIRPIVLSLAAILLTSLVVAEAYSHAKALHIRDPEDLALAYLLPTIFIAAFFGSTFAVAGSFGGGLAAAYLIYSPQASVWIDDPNHVAELGFILVLAITASKAVGVIIDGKPLGSSAARAASRRT